MNNADKQYLEYLQHILDNGVEKIDRTGTGTISVFDYSMRFNMTEGFPLLTSKKMFTKGVIHELIWFLNGDTNIKYLVDNNVNIWNGDAYKNYQKNGGELSIKDFIEQIKTNDVFAKKWGELGNVYGKQWRDWNGIDQIKDLIHNLNNNPDSRRLMVSAWNVEDVPNVVLPPCHYLFQCYTKEMTLVDRIESYCASIGKDTGDTQHLTHEILDALNFPKRKISLKWYQRSVDSFLGLPFNIASYGILLHLIAKEVNMLVDDLIFSGGDCHIYTNHIDQVKQQLNQKIYDLCNIKLNNNSIFDFKYEDIEILNYRSSPSIKGKLSN